MLGTESFFAFARERYQVFLNKEAGLPKPWTQDEVLQNYRFCNVFREDDTTTKWIREHVTRERYGRRFLGAMIIARWFNRIETLELLKAPDDCEPPFFLHDLLFSWGEDMHCDWWANAMRERLSGVQPLVTGAYMIKTPAGLTKLEGLLDCLGKILPDARDIQLEMELFDETLESATAGLQAYPYLGPFMAYEVVTDLRHSILSEASDIMTWANPGPGAIRGIGRVVNECPDTFRSNQKPLMMIHMRNLLEESQDPTNWPAEWPSWEMREVEHCLCEMDKYERARLQQGTPKQRYKGAE